MTKGEEDQEKERRDKKGWISNRMKSQMGSPGGMTFAGHGPLQLRGIEYMAHPCRARKTRPCLPQSPPIPAGAPSPRPTPCGVAVRPMRNEGGE